MTLAEWLTANRVSHDDFAARIGATRSSVTRYASGERIPRPPKMAAIARETGGQVTANDFVASATATAVADDDGVRPPERSVA